MLDRTRFWTVFFIASLLAVPVALSIPEPPDAIAKPKKRKRKRKRAAPKPPPAEAAPTPQPVESDLVPSRSFRGPTRLDFDDRLIQGQTNKSGAVYLFDRKETGISSMVRRRKSFRKLTIRTIYDR